MASLFLCFIIFSSLLTLSSSSSPTLTLTLSPLHSSNQSDLLTSIVNSTIHRAYHLKNPHKKTGDYTQTPLYPRSYGGYSVSLSFGTPPQSVPLVFDTGSSLLWVPCTTQYACQDCTFSGVDPARIPVFRPDLSSSSELVPCTSPKCGWLFGPENRARCGPARRCPGYELHYGSGATAGLPITETLDLPGGEAVPGFFMGCSVVSARQPEGIVGFGRAPTSVPSQLNLKRFSYCLVSHKFDDNPKKSSELVLAGKSTGNVAGVRYTRFHKNPDMPPYDEYYYVNLNKITVGKKRVKLPSHLLRPSASGTGGVIVDSGSTLTFMDRALFDPVVSAIETYTSGYKRAKDVEVESGFGLCYDVSGVKNATLRLPRLVFHFMGGAKMALPGGNYFSFVGGPGALCLTIVTDSSPSGSGGPTGPAVILGNYQQQNFYIEYDLENQRFGFKKQKCG